MIAMLCDLRKVEESALAAVGAVKRIPTGEARLAVDAGFLAFGRLASVFAGSFLGAGIARVVIPALEPDERLARFAAVLALVDGYRCGDVVSLGKGIVVVKHICLSRF